MLHDCLEEKVIVQQGEAIAAVPQRCILESTLRTPMYKFAMTSANVAPAYCNSGLRIRSLFRRMTCQFRSFALSAAQSTMLPAKKQPHRVCRQPDTERHQGISTA